MPKPRTVAALIRVYRRENGGIAPEVRLAPDGTVTLAPPVARPKDDFEKWREGL